MNTVSIFIATLWLMKLIDDYEAGLLQNGLRGKAIPTEWDDVIDQVEEIIRRKL